MARTAGGKDQLEMAQAVLLPLELGLGMAQTALAIGHPAGVACAMRTRYSKVARKDGARHQ